MREDLFHSMLSELKFSQRLFNRAQFLVRESPVEAIGHSLRFLYAANAVDSSCDGWLAQYPGDSEGGQRFVVIVSDGSQDAAKLFEPTGIWLLSEAPRPPEVL